MNTAAHYTQIMDDADRCLISTGNFLELSIVLEGQIGTEAVRQCDMFFRGAGIVIEPFTVEQAHLARQAFARQFGEPLLLKGEDFKKPTASRPRDHERLLQHVAAGVL